MLCYLTRGQTRTDNLVLEQLQNPHNFTQARCQALVHHFPLTINMHVPTQVKIRRRLRHQYLPLLPPNPPQLQLPSLHRHITLASDRRRRHLEPVIIAVMVMMIAVGWLVCLVLAVP